MLVKKLMPDDFLNALTISKLRQYLEQGFPIKIGKYSYGGPRLHWSKGDYSHSLEIGAFCSIADDVSIFVGKHGRHAIDYISTYPMGLVFGASKEKVVSKSQIGNLSVSIGSDVWIGRGATIMAGVKLGHGSVIAARAVVTKDVLPYSIVGGVPAHEIKRRFSDEVIEKLLRICWWGWSDEKITENIGLFNSPYFFEHLDKFLGEKSDI